MEGGSNDALWASIMNNKDAMGNNPFLWLVFLAMCGRNGFGACGGEGNIAQTLTDNHNTDLLMSSIRENGCNINNGIDSVNAAINTLGSATALGNANLASTFKDCCCQSRMETQKMGYENQISNLQQTNALLSRIDQLAHGVQTGFAQVGYAAAQQTCELKTNQNENTQRIVDILNSHWTSDLAQRYNDAKLELSQSTQTAALIAALRPA